MQRDLQNDDRQLELPASVHPAGDAEAQHAAAISSKATLRDLAGEYAFFHHGALMSHGGLNVDPVQSFVEKTNATIGHLTFPEPICHNADNGNPEYQAWNHMLLLVPRQWEAGLERFLSSIAVIDHDRRSFFRALSNTIDIVDWLRIQHLATRPDHWPRVSARVFGVDGTDGFVQVHAGHSADAAPHRFRFVRCAPRTETMVAGARLLRGADPSQFL